MSLYIPLPCCECTASTNPCDLPCFVSGVATISGSISVSGSGNGNRKSSGSSALLSPVPYIYTIGFSLNDSVSLNSSGNGQTDSIVALLKQNFQYAAGTNCDGDDCTGITVVGGNVTYDLSCPANACIGGQEYQQGTSLSFSQNNFQETNCNFFNGISHEDHITEYYCDETYPLDPVSVVGLSYVACSNNEFAFSFEFDDSLLAFSTTQGDGYIEIGQIFIDNLDPRPFYVGCNAPVGFNSKTITGSMNVVVDRVTGYINENYDCVAP